MLSACRLHCYHSTHSVLMIQPSLLAPTSGIVTAGMRQWCPAPTPLAWQPLPSGLTPQQTCRANNAKCGQRVSACCWGGGGPGLRAGVAKQEGCEQGTIAPCLLKRLSKGCLDALFHLLSKLMHGFPALFVGWLAAPDSIFWLVMLIQNSVPTALNVHTLATLNSNREEEVGALLFWQ